MASISQEAEIKRFHFKPRTDIELCKLVIADPPFLASHGQTQEKWEAIQARLSITNWRALRDRFNLLIRQYKSENMANLRKSGTEEEYTEREQLLEELCDLLGEKQLKEARPSQVDNSKAVREYSLRTLGDKGELQIGETASPVAKKRKNAEIIDLIKAQEERVSKNSAEKIVIEKRMIENETIKLENERQRIQLEQERLSFEKSRFEEELRLRKEEQMLSHTERKDMIYLLKGLLPK